MRLSRRASSLASTLLLIAICVSLAFTVISLAFHHLNLSNRLGNSQQARNLAESAVSLMIEKVLKADGDYPKAGDDTALVQFPDLDQRAFGVTTFDAGVASARGVSLCKNNLKQDTPTTAANGRVVPRESLYLVGLGRCGGIERRVEVILQVPIFQSAISAESALECTGPMLVASADSSADDELLTHPESHMTQLKPAHVTTNRDGLIDSGVTITGFAQAAGSLEVDPAADVQGGARSRAGRSEVPFLDINKFDPNQLGFPHALAEPTPGNFKADGGLIRMNSDVVGNELVLPNGVDKAGALVFVDGDIRVKEIRGVGAVIATGNITVTASSNLSSEGTVALLAGNDMSLTGSKPEADAIIKGIAYAGGALKVDNITLVGTMVQAGSESTDRMRVLKANFIKTNDTVDFEFDMPFSEGAGGGTAPNAFDLRLKPPLKLEDFCVGGAYAVDSNGNGVWDDGPPALDTPTRPVTLNDLEFCTLSGAPRTIDQVAAAWVSEPIPPLRPANTWLAATGTATPNADQIKQYLETQALPNIIRYRLHPQLVRIERFYEAFLLEPKKKGKISFNPSRFLTLTKATRIVLWKDL
ncbi:MAG: hypothetical protein U0931_15710 [Vulcanimicrobiota bacterium]